MKSLFESVFGDDFWNFSNNLFNFQERKMIGNGIGSGELTVDEGKYKQTFPLHGDIDVKCLNVSVDAEKQTVTVKYDKEDEGSSVHYKYMRTLPADVDFKSAKANVDGETLVLTYDKLPEQIEEKKAKEIPIDFGE